MSKALEDVRRIEKLAKHLLVKKLTIVLNKPRTALPARFEKRANVAMIYGLLRAFLDEWLKLSPLGFSLEQLRAFNISRVFAANQKLATIKKIGEFGLREQLVEISTLVNRNVSCLASI